MMVNVRVFDGGSLVVDTRPSLAAPLARSLSQLHRNNRHGISFVVVTVVVVFVFAVKVVVIVVSGGDCASSPVQRHQFQVLRRLLQLLHRRWRVRRRVSMVHRVLGAAVELLLEWRQRSWPTRDHRVDRRNGGHHRTAVMVTATAAALSHVVVSTAPAAATVVATTEAAPAPSTSASKAPPVPVPLRVVVVGLAATARHRARSLVLVRAAAAHSEPTEQHE